MSHRIDPDFASSAGLQPLVEMHDELVEQVKNYQECMYVHGKAGRWGDVKTMNEALVVVQEDLARLQKILKL